MRPMSEQEALGLLKSLKTGDLPKKAASFFAKKLHREYGQGDSDANGCLQTCQFLQLVAF